MIKSDNSNVLFREPYFIVTHPTFFSNHKLQDKHKTFKEAKADPLLNDILRDGYFLGDNSPPDLPERKRGV
jgi:hypothetical protein